jgi:hypothetical protein
MLIVKGDIALVIKHAQETDSMDALISRLKYLNGYDTYYNKPCDVHLYVDQNRPSQCGIAWVDGYDPIQVLMAGGLVHHAYDNSWGTHT